MNDPLRTLFIRQIESLTGFDFQRFIKELFFLYYGIEGFQSLRETKDKGCDGIILSSRTVIACYGPEAYDKNQFLKKADEDFKDYMDHWSEQYPNWRVIINHVPSPDQIQKVDTLKPGSLVHGLDHLIRMIEKMEGVKRRKTGSYLKIDSSFFTKDYIKEIIDDLIQDNPISLTLIQYKGVVEIREKIELNYDQSDVDSALEEYGLVITRFKDIDNIIKGYEDGEKDRLKHRIISDYKGRSGTFKQRLDNLTNIYLEKYGPDDDDYRFNIRALLFYVFEQCLIGRKTAQEL